MAIGAPIRLPERLTDGDVVLDAYTLADAEAHWLGEDDEMRRRFDWPLQRKVTLEHTRGVMRQWMEARVAGGPMFVYAIRSPAGVLMGGCELRRKSADRLNVSWWLYPAFRGQGHAVRAVRLLCEAALTLEGVRQLEAPIDEDNRSSRRLAERLGFMAKDTAPDAEMASGVRVQYVRKA